MERSTQSSEHCYFTRESHFAFRKGLTNYKLLDRATRKYSDVEVSMPLIVPSRLRVSLLQIWFLILSRLDSLTGFIALLRLKANYDTARGPCHCSVTSRYDFAKTQQRTGQSCHNIHKRAAAHLSFLIHNTRTHYCHIHQSTSSNNTQANFQHEPTEQNVSGFRYREHQGRPPALVDTSTCDKERRYMHQRGQGRTVRSVPE